MRKTPSRRRFFRRAAAASVAVFGGRDLAPSAQTPASQPLARAVHRRPVNNAAYRKTKAELGVELEAWMKRTADTFRSAPRPQ